MGKMFVNRFFKEKAIIFHLIKTNFSLFLRKGFASTLIEIFLTPTLIVSNFEYNISCLIHVELFARCHWDIKIETNVIWSKVVDLK